MCKPKVILKLKSVALRMKTRGLGDLLIGD
jgi:hypothetical protein